MDAYGDLLAEGEGRIPENYDLWLTMIRSQDQDKTHLVEGRLGFLRKHGPSLGVAACVVLVLAVYVFFGSAGSWTHWQVPKRYYNDLAAAFREGRTDLGIQAPAELLSLANPYDPDRKSSADVKQFVEDNWDLSFYDGKFYAYWGPVPAVILSVVKLTYRTDIADQYLAFGFAGLLFFTALLMSRCIMPSQLTHRPS